MVYAGFFKNYYFTLSSAHRMRSTLKSNGSLRSSLTLSTVKPGTPSPFETWNSNLNDKHFFSNRESNLSTCSVTLVAIWRRVKKSLVTAEKASMRPGLKFFSSASSTSVASWVMLERGKESCNFGHFFGEKLQLRAEVKCRKYAFCTNFAAILGTNFCGFF